MVRMLLYKIFIKVDIARLMKNLVEKKEDKKREQYDDKKVEQAIKDAEKELKIHYDDTQKLAIKNAVNQPISILTGGPGTGKTTIINGILLVLRKLAEIPSSALYSEDPPFLLAAPTGRAAKRMGEITGISAKTIHRMLGLGIGDTNTQDLNELNGEILIVDEMSMVDMFLFKQLLASIHDTRHIVFDSTIITLAHDVNEGKDPQALFKKTNNYSFISCRPELVGDAVGQIVKLALKRGFAKDDIQVLSAMYLGNGGVTNLNNVIQVILNPSQPKSKVLEAHNEVFRIGDRILQLQNNPEKDIYNGQIGKIISIDEDDAKECMIADFDGREVAFSRKDLNDLTRAYAITIHKSQGSEFPLVILNLTMQNFVMLKRNLLYTAITRAEKNLVLVGDPRAFVAAFKTPGNDRKTGLAAKICQQLGITKSLDKSDQSKQHEKAQEMENETDKAEVAEDFVLTSEKIYSGEIDPMIGMENIKL